MRHRVIRDPQAAAPGSDPAGSGMSATTCTIADVVHYQPPWPPLAVNGGD